MSVYVDELFKYPFPKDAQARRVAQRNGGQWCHLTADAEEELHLMARKIGMRREWAQKAGTLHAHYDLTPGRREEALKAGAIFKPAKEQAKERISKMEARYAAQSRAS